jgi:hypothetical protein
VEEDGANLMSLDHLFLDQDAIPTLVEVKRSNDIRIRREVVGQMLDYAANAVAYWSADSLRTRFETSCAGENQDPTQLVAELLEADPEDEEAIEDFWGKVKTNLQAGRIRLIFVADEIPRELRRVVEFLNRFTDPVEVLAVEVHQYVGRGLKTLVPRVIGQSEEAKGRKGGSAAGSRQWDEASFFHELERRRGAEESGVARKILDWSQANMPSIYWGKGQRSGSFIPGLEHGGIWHQAIGVRTYGSVELQFQYMQSKPPFDEEKKRLELLHRLNRVPGIQLSENAINRRPSVPLSTLVNSEVLEQFLETLTWFTNEVKAT